jgi:hypothetical protein
MTSKVVSTLIDLDKQQFPRAQTLHTCPKVRGQIKFQFKKSGIKLSTIGVSASLYFWGGNFENV